MKPYLDEVVGLDLCVVPPPRGLWRGRPLHGHLEDHLLVDLAVHVALRELWPDSIDLKIAIRFVKKCLQSKISKMIDVHRD